MKCCLFRALGSFPLVKLQMYMPEILLYTLQLTEAVGKVKVQTTQFDYYNYQPKDPDLDDDGTYSSDFINK